MLNKKVLSAAAGALLLTGMIVGLAQTADKSDEQTLRELIRQRNEGKDVIKYTDNVIFVSGAYPRPIIGREAFRHASPGRTWLVSRERSADRFTSLRTATDL
jgi:hypothetical protein